MMLNCFGIDKLHGFMMHSVKMITLSYFQMLAAMVLQSCCNRYCYNFTIL